MALPEYIVIIWWDPTDKEDELKEACPPDTVTDGCCVPSMLNVTVPVAALGDIVAVKVTELLKMDGFCDDESDVVVVIWLTTCVRGDEVQGKICSGHGLTRTFFIFIITSDVFLF